MTDVCEAGDEVLSALMSAITESAMTGCHENFDNLLPAAVVEDAKCGLNKQIMPKEMREDFDGCCRRLSPTLKFFAPNGNLNYRGSYPTPLFGAIALGRVHEVKALLEHGANPNYVCQDAPYQTAGRWVTHVPNRDAGIEMFEALKVRDYDFNATESVYPRLHSAAMQDLWHDEEPDGPWQDFKVTGMLAVVHHCGAENWAQGLEWLINNVQEMDIFAVDSQWCSGASHAAAKPNFEEVLTIFLNHAEQAGRLDMFFRTNKKDDTVFMKCIANCTSIATRLADTRARYNHTFQDCEVWNYDFRGVTLDWDVGDRDKALSVKELEMLPESKCAFGCAVRAEDTALLSSPIFLKMSQLQWVYFGQRLVLLEAATLMLDFTCGLLVNWDTSHARVAAAVGFLPMLLALMKILLQAKEVLSNVRGMCREEVWSVAMEYRHRRSFAAALDLLRVATGGYAHIYYCAQGSHGTQSMQCSCIFILLTTFAFFDFLTFSQKIGTYVIMVNAMLGDFALWMVLWLMFLIAWMIPLYGIAIETGAHVEYSIWDVNFILFEWTLGSGDYALIEAFGDDYKWFGKWLYAIFAMLVMVLLLNMLIAAMATTYDSVLGDAPGQYNREMAEHMWRLKKRAKKLSKYGVRWRWVHDLAGYHSVIKELTLNDGSPEKKNIYPRRNEGMETKLEQLDEKLNKVISTVEKLFEAVNAMRLQRPIGLQHGPAGLAPLPAPVPLSGHNTP